MTTFGSMVLPDGFFVDETDSPELVSRTRGESELIEARDLALDNPGKYVRVGEMRWLTKAPATWCNEVNTGKKKCLTGYTGTFTAWYFKGDETRVGLGGQREYGKAIVYTPHGEVAIDE